MTEKQKLILIRLFLISRKLNRAKSEKTAREYSETMAKLTEEFLKEIDIIRKG